MWDVTSACSCSNHSELEVAEEAESRLWLARQTATGQDRFSVP